MKKKKIISLLIIISIIMIILAIILRTKTNKLTKTIQILDATYSCQGIDEDFYEDDKYLYSFPCQKSTSVFVKFNDGNKILVTKALKDKKVTIQELEDAGLKFNKREK